MDNIRTRIRSDEIDKTVNASKQSRHIGNSSADTSGRSYIYGNMDTAQSLVDQYHGTGEIRFDARGNWINKEFVTLNRDIGIHVNANTESETPTNSFAIHYSKSGTHVVPSERKVSL